MSVFDLTRTELLTVLFVFSELARGELLSCDMRKLPHLQRKARPNLPHLRFLSLEKALFILR